MKKPSVSQLLDLLAKPGLIGWANKQGLAGIEIKARRAQSLKAGVSIHSQIESGCFDTHEDMTNYCAFMRGKQIIDSEQDIETEWFVGRYDVRFTDGVDEYIADYKKSKRGTLYFERKLQLIAYTMAKPARMAVVAVPAFQMIPFETDDRGKYEQVLIHLSRIWQLKQELKA